MFLLDKRGYAMSMRTFISIDIEDVNIISKISLIKNTLSSLGLDLKLVEDENLHLTLVFIGEIPETILSPLKESLSTVVHKSFKMHLSGAGCFPSCNKPRVLWIGVSEGSDEIIELHRKITNALKRGGIPFEKEKDFTPHLTIARIKSNRNVNKLSKFMETIINEDFGWIEVREFRLKKSILTPKGPIYETLNSFKLAQ